ELPADYTFVAPDHGSHTFRDITLKTAGAQSLAAHAAGSIAGVASVAVAAPSKGEQQQPAAPQPVAPPAAPQPSASTTADPAQAGSVTVAPSSGTAAPTTVAWAPSTFGTAPAHVSATVEPPAKTSG